jgi:hypothetical protein
MSSIVSIDPALLHLPPSRFDGADPGKLHRQIAKHGASTERMPPLWVHSDPDGLLMIVDGVTRAVRVAKLLPGTTVPVEIVGRLSKSCDYLPTIRERLP